MLRPPPKSTRPSNSFPTRRSSDLCLRNISPVSVQNDCELGASLEPFRAKPDFERQVKQPWLRGCWHVRLFVLVFASALLDPLQHGFTPERFLAVNLQRALRNHFCAVERTTKHLQYLTYIVELKASKRGFLVQIPDPHREIAQGVLAVVPRPNMHRSEEHTTE